VQPSSFKWPALRIRNVRVLLFAQAISLLTNSIRQITLLWLIYQTSHSPLILGIAAFLRDVSGPVTLPLVGVWADRKNPIRIAVATQLVLSVQALVFAQIIHMKVLSLPLIMALIFVFGILGSADMPIRQMLVPRLVETNDHLVSAVAVNAMIYDGMRIIGPIVAGVVIARFHEAASFLVGGAGQLLAMALFSMINVAPHPSATVPETIPRAFMTGVKYATSDRAIGNIIALSICVSFAGAAYMVLLPVVAEQVIGGGPGALGFLVSSVAVGALIGGLFFGSRRSSLTQAPLIPVGAALFGAGLVFFSFCFTLPAAVIGSAVTGFGIMIMMASCNTTLVRLTPPDKQSRILSLFVFSYAVASPIGSLLFGFAAAHVGSPLAIRVGGCVCVIAGLTFGVRVLRSLGAAR
jgi:MFS family permease